jgi:hypothetical protein
MEVKGLLLSYWFEIRSCDVNRSQCSIASQRRPHSGTRIAAQSQKLVFSLISFGTLVALRTRRSSEMARDLPCMGAGRRQIAGRHKGK